MPRRSRRLYCLSSCIPCMLDFSNLFSMKFYSHLQKFRTNGSLHRYLPNKLFATLRLRSGLSPFPHPYFFPCLSTTVFHISQDSDNKDAINIIPKDAAPCFSSLVTLHSLNMTLHPVSVELSAPFSPVTGFPPVLLPVNVENKRPFILTREIALSLALHEGCHF